MPRDGVRLLRQEEATSVAVKTAMRDVLGGIYHGLVQVLGVI